jgi:pimeloyl-ACP methyl ester carboxylesterase
MKTRMEPPNQDVDDFTRTFARPDGFRGTSGLYRSMLQEGDEIRELAAQSRLQMPVLAIGAGSGDFPHHTMTQVAERVSAATLDGVGHYAAMEAPEALAQALLDYYRSIDAEPPESAAAHSATRPGQPHRRPPS